MSSNTVVILVIELKLKLNKHPHKSLLYVNLLRYTLTEGKSKVGVTPSPPVPVSQCGMTLFVCLRVESVNSKLTCYMFCVVFITLD